MRGALHNNRLFGMGSGSHERKSLRRDVFILVTENKVRRNGFPSWIGRGLVQCRFL
jgi:hypothetical protein